VNFISDLEEIVPAFYRDIGQDLGAWKKSAPRIKDAPAIDLLSETDDAGSDCA